MLSQTPPAWCRTSTTWIRCTRAILIQAPSFHFTSRFRKLLNNFPGSSSTPRCSSRLAQITRSPATWPPASHSQKLRIKICFQLSRRWCRCQKLSWLTRKTCRTAIGTSSPTIKTQLSRWSQPWWFLRPSDLHSSSPQQYRLEQHLGGQIRKFFFFLKKKKGTESWTRKFDHF